MLRREDWLVVGISGVTCGGKTSLANRLRSCAAARVLHQDRYFLPDDHPRHVAVPDLVPHHNNYDILDALDMAQMHRDVLDTLEGRDRSHPAEDAACEAGAWGAKPYVLILEGFTVLNYPPLMELCDLRYYLVLEYGECVSRRALRLYDPPDVAGYFEACVWPEHLRYRAQLEKDPRVQFLSGARSDVLDVVLGDLRGRGVHVEC